jgi:hypothetical protein
MRRTHELYAAAQFAVHMDFVVVADDDVVEILPNPPGGPPPSYPIVASKLSTVPYCYPPTHDFVGPPRDEFSESVPYRGPDY